MMKNQCWASKPHVPVFNRGTSSDKMIQKWSKQQIGDWWGEHAITSHRQMSIQMFPCGSLSACLTKTFLVKEGHALMLLNIKRTEKRKVGGTCLFCLSQPTSRCLPQSPDLCTPLLATDNYGIDCSYFAFPLSVGNRLSETPLWKHLWVLAWETPQSWCLLASRGKDFQLNDSLLFHYKTIAHP